MIFLTLIPTKWEVLNVYQNNQKTIDYNSALLVIYYLIQHILACMATIHYNKYKIFDVHMSVHRKYISELQPKRCNVFSIYLFL
jgi:hypothetical protein